MGGASGTSGNGVRSGANADTTAGFSGSPFGACPAATGWAHTSAAAAQSSAQFVTDNVRQKTPDEARPEIGDRARV